MGANVLACVITLFKQARFIAIEERALHGEANTVQVE
jgi:hypothetical protein